MTTCPKCDGLGITTAYGPAISPERCVAATGICSRCGGTGQDQPTFTSTYTETAQQFILEHYPEPKLVPSITIPFCYYRSDTYRRYRWLSGHFQTDAHGAVVQADRHIWTQLQLADIANIPGHSHVFHGPATYADSTVYYIPQA